MIALFVAGFMIHGFAFQAARADDSPFPGFKTKEQQIEVATEAEMLAWKFQPASLAEFINTVKQPCFQTIGSSESPGVYCVLFRAPHGVLISAYLLLNGKKPSNFSCRITGKGEDQSMLDHRPKSMTHIVLLETKLVNTDKATGATGGRVDSMLVNSVFGNTARINSGYTGPLTMKGVFWNEGKNDGIRLRFSVTGNWEALPPAPGQAQPNPADSKKKQTT